MNALDDEVTRILRESEGDPFVEGAAISALELDVLAYSSDEWIPFS